MSETQDQAIRSKIKEKFWDEYKFNTITLSTVCRQLAFAEGGVCSFFRLSDGKLPTIFLLVLGLLVFFFFCDVAQYLISTIVYNSYGKYYEKRLEKGLLNEQDIKKPERINKCANSFLYVKLFFLFIASVFIVIGFGLVVFNKVS
jgi:hypothetical protein